MDRSKIVWCVLGLLVPFTIYEAWVLTRQEPYRIKSLRMQLSIVLSTLMFLCSGYIWKRTNIILNQLTLHVLSIILKVLVLVFLVLAQVSFVCIVFAVGADPLLLSFVATFCLGSLVLLTFSMIVVDICSYLYKIIICRRSPASNSYPTAEIKIRMLLSLIIGLFLIMTGAIGVNSLGIEHVTVPIEGLNSQLNGTTVVQVSDIHLGPFSGRSRLSVIVEKVNNLNPDIVVITGDLVDSSVDALKEAVMPLRKLKSKYGIYYITGMFDVCFNNCE